MKLFKQNSSSREHRVRHSVKMFLLVLLSVAATFADLVVNIKDSELGTLNRSWIHLKIDNVGTNILWADSLILYYYFTPDSGQTPVLETSWGIPNGMTAIMESLPKGQKRIRIRTGAVSMVPGSRYPAFGGEIAFGLHNAGYSTPYTPDNDYSYYASTVFGQTDHIPVYANGGLVGGIEPTDAPLTATNIPPLMPQLSNYSVFGKQGLDVAQSAIISGGVVGSDGPVHLGWYSNVSADVLCGGDFTMDQGAMDSGSVYASGTITKSAYATVKGMTSSGVAIRPQFIPTPFMEYNSTPVFVATNSIDTLPPGIYGALTVSQGATLILKSGTYGFTSFYCGNSSTVKFLDTVPDVTTIKVYGNFILDQSAQMIFVKNPSPFSARIYILGGTGTSIALPYGGKIYATIFAMTSKITVPTTCSIYGAIYADTVSLAQSSNVIRPRALADFSVDNGTYTPAFDPTVLYYKVLVPSSTTSITPSVLTENIKDSCKINGQKPGTPIALSSTTTKLWVTVLPAKSGITTKYLFEVVKTDDRIVYVNINNTFTTNVYNGATWNTAFKSLQQGLDEAARTGKEVRVAEGVYSH